MNLIVCSEKCAYQQDGYCVLEHPRAIANPQGPAENRCIYLEKPGSADASSIGSSGDLKTPH